VKRERRKKCSFWLFKQQLFAHSSQHEKAMTTQILESVFTKL